MSCVCVGGWGEGRGGRGGEGVEVTHLLYIDDVIIFCEARAIDTFELE